MQHLGDITAISGYDVLPVDVVIGGSPCQDLSIAGKRAGLDGERSGLFMEQIRVIGEMRDADIHRGRTGRFIRPRLMLWENVPGAFSSNGGEDFRVVLEETARIVQKDAVIPRPPGGKWRTSGCIMGDGWSIAWRVLDAQFWGVPQRRRRIALVADFGGHAAPEVLFVRKSVSGHFAESGTQGEETAVGTGSSTYPAIARSLTARYDGSPCVDRGPNVVVQGAVTAFHLTQDPIIGVEGTPCLSAGNPKYGQASIGVCIPINDKATRFRGGGDIRCNDGAGNGLGVGQDGDPSPTLTAGDRHAVFDVRGNGGSKTVCTLTDDHQSRIADYTAIIAQTTYQKVTGPLCANSHPGSHTGQDAYNDMLVTPNVAHTLRARGNDPHREDAATYPITNGMVRRLTPLECERLQGFPDKWTDIGTWIDSKGKRHETSDSARYKALGNSIALPPWKWVLKRISAQYERDVTMASLFDGISGFCLLWAQLNGLDSVKWASEIEEFPVAVCKKHFGDEETGEKGDLSEILFG